MSRSSHLQGRLALQHPGQRLSAHLGRSTLRRKKLSSLLFSSSCDARLERYLRKWLFFQFARSFHTEVSIGRQCSLPFFPGRSGIRCPCRFSEPLPRISGPYRGRLVSRPFEELPAMFFFRRCP